MKIFLTFLSLLFLMGSMYAQEGDVHLIDPIIISQPLSADRINLRESGFRNWGIEQLGFDSVMARLTGIGQIGCICDTGLPNHRDYLPMILDAANFSTDDSVDDGHGHSTHVAGIWNEIAPDAKLLFAKVLANNGFGSSQRVAKGIDWCVAKGATVINLSLGSSTGDPTLLASIVAAKAAGATVVAAAGNSGSGQDKDNIGFPARWEQVLAVGSIDSDGGVSYFSSSGNTGDVMAPGGRILSTYLNNEYRIFSGTSMASPFVAGVTCLFRQMVGNDGLIEQHFEETATDIPPPGYDNLSFWGVISPAAFGVPDQPDPEPEPQPQPGFNLFGQWWFWAGSILICAGIVFFVFLRRRE